MSFELKPKYWAILNQNMEIAFIPIKCAKNKVEAIRYYRENVLNQWQRERYKEFEYTAKPVVSYSYGKLKKNRKS